METLTTTHTTTVQDCLDHSLYTWSKQKDLRPLEVVSAKGCHFTTADGKTYLDFASQQVNMNIGHGVKEIQTAIQAQMDDFSFSFPGSATAVRAKLSKKLAEITPDGLDKAFYTISGAEANENAIKIARLVTGRHKIITFYRSYHGASYGAISAGGDPRKLAVDSSSMANVVHVENPYSYRCPWNSSTEEECKVLALAHLERVIQFEGTSSIAAILIEGESGTSGCIKYPEGYWKGVIKLAKKYGILTISDEVMSGFGRTGSWFGVQHHGVTPDMMTMAKGITGGYLPLGAVMVSTAIAKFFETTALPLGLTNNSHPVCLAAALAAIDYYESEELLINATVMGNYLNQELNNLKKNHPSLGDVRMTGLLGCLEIVKNGQSKSPMAPFNATPEEMEPMNKLNAKLRALGLFTLVRWNWVFIAPPLTISAAECDKAIKIIDLALNETDDYTHA